MKDFYLKAASQSALYQALEAAGVVVRDEDGNFVISDSRYALDVIGTIYKPTGKVLMTQDGEVQETTAMAGFHANLRVMQDDDAASAKLDAIAIEPPTTPARVWA